MAVELPVKALRQIIDPFKTDPWDCGGITIAEVSEAIAEGRFCVRRHSPVRWGRSEDGLTRKEHIERVAYLTVHPSNHPVEIDVGVPACGSFCDYPLQDGHHRLAAAIMRGDEFILAEVSGQLSYATELFGVECDERSPCARRVDRASFNTAEA